jgi:hypothetical protein
MAAEDTKRDFIKPIENATYPGTLASLNLAVLQVSGKEIDSALKLVLLLGAAMFLSSAVSIFIYTIYPRTRIFWTTTAVTFAIGLGLSLFSVGLLWFA